MKLRDDDFDSIDSLCNSIGIERTELETKLAAIGYKWNEENHRFT